MQISPHGMNLDVYRTKRHFEKMVHTVGMEIDSFHKRLCPYRLTALRNQVPWSLMAQNVIGTRAFDERNASYMRLIFNFKNFPIPFLLWL